MLKEIVLSEMRYVEGLESLHKDFMIPLAEHDYLSAEDHSVIFGTVLEILDFHRKLLAELETLNNIPDVKKKQSYIFLL